MQGQITYNKNGQFFQQDFPDNTGGLNLVDSVFKIAQNQAAGGYNYDYVLTGGVRKRLGPTKINSSPDTQLDTLGFGLYAPTSGTSKSLFRAAGSKFQLFNTDSPSFTNLIDDTAVAGSSPFMTSSSQDVQMSQFSTGTTDILWAVGGGSANPVGAYSTSNYTSNGVPTPLGTFSANVNMDASGSWTTGNFGIFYYTIVLRKKSTQALSNAGYLAVLGAQAVDPFATTTGDLTDSVDLAWTLTNVDTTLIDKIYIYRSAVGGVSGFITGSLIAQLPSTDTTFKDLGDLGNPDVLLVQTIPRAGSLITDNSPLPTGTYNTLVNWQHRLVTSSGNNLYISDVNKSESYPLVNYITIPSAGPITALANISFTSPQANSLQDLLVIFKERELWVLSGTAYTNWSLVKIDNTGCPQQSLVVTAQGFLSWIDFRGVHLWNGTGKPIYCSRPIEPLFGASGDLDKSKFSQGVGAFFRRENQIIWYLSSKTFGTQKFAIKMDLRLTLLQVFNNLEGNTIDGVFIQDSYAFPVYAALSYIPLEASNEQMVLGDISGYCYFASNGFSDGGLDYTFQYMTPPLCFGDPNTLKQFHKIVVWVQDIGDWDLELDYWADYKAGANFQTIQSLPISTESQQVAALYDIAYYDTAYYDAYTPNVVPLVFNLQSGSDNSTQGSAIQLQFQNKNANQPITIHGFSVLYSVMGGITQ